MRNDLVNLSLFLRAFLGLFTISLTVFANGASEQQLQKWRQHLPTAEQQILSLLLAQERVMWQTTLAKGGNVSGGGNDFISLKSLDYDEAEIVALQSFQLDILGLTQLQQMPAGNIQSNIVVMDSGMLPNTRAAKNVVAFHDFTKICTSDQMCDQALHGTLVTDIIVQAAPSAKIISLKILDRNLSGKMQDIIAALKWIKENYKSHNIKVVNLSLTSPERLSGDYNQHDIARSLVRELSGFGILFVAATGNDYRKSVDFFPASLPEVMTVGSYAHQYTYEPAKHRVSIFNNMGIAQNPITKQNFGGFGTERVFAFSSIKPDVFSPGEMITACADQCYLLSGSSFAAAFVSGGLLEMNSRQPVSSVAEILSLLKYTKQDNPTLIEGTNKKIFNIDFSKIISIHKNQNIN